MAYHLIGILKNCIYYIWYQTLHTNQMLHTMVPDYWVWFDMIHIGIDIGTRLMDLNQFVQLDCVRSKASSSNLTASTSTR